LYVVDQNAGTDQTSNVFDYLMQLTPVVSNILDNINTINISNPSNNDLANLRQINSLINSDPSKPSQALIPEY